MEKTTRQILLEAADVIRERGWCQYSRMDRRGRVCAVGAIQIARHGGMFVDDSNPYEDPAAICVSNLLVVEKQSSLPTEVALSYWNDTVGRTADQVIALLERAAAQDCD